jgi:uncharacterized metal-binding protein YceD (DUF177 family)
MAAAFWRFQPDFSWDVLDELCQESQFDTEGFGKFYRPLDEHQKQLEAGIPRLAAEIDIAKVNNPFAKLVAIKAQYLSSN